nr:reverse transcriptase domain-containing protein [Tanacetum cinerariifolium]
LKRKIEEMLKAGKLSHLIKELKQNHGKDQTKIAKKGETPGKDKPLAKLMVQPWQKIARQRITKTFFPKSVISFPTLGEEDGTEGPMIIEEARKKQNFKRGNFWNEQRMERKQDRFTLLTKTPREIIALDKGKFKPPSSMTTPVEKRNANKFCEFHGK